MTKKLVCIMLLGLSGLFLATSAYADFDESLWGKYAEILIPPEEQLPPLGGIHIEPGYFDSANAAGAFSDIRIITDGRKEAPYQIITRSPSTSAEEVNVKMLNLSYKNKNETYFTGLIEKMPVIYNSIEVITTEKNFYAQVLLFGSVDGVNLQPIRGDAVIFDYSKEESMRHLKLTFPDSNYKFLAVKVVNNADRALPISGLKVFYRKTDPGIEAGVGAWIAGREENKRDRESIIVANVDSLFPIRKIDLNTGDKNFQRKIEVWVKRGDKEWSKWADDIIFSFDTEKLKENKLYVSFPELSAGEIKLVIKNYDSPPINIEGIRAFGYKKVLIFKIEGKQKYFIFWGNDLSRPSQYDISRLVAKIDINDVRIFPVGVPKINPKFIGYRERLPFTERYKYILYGAVAFVMILLIALQFRVIKRTDET